MFRTIGGFRSWRPVLLLLAGAALGMTLIAPVAARDSAATEPAVTTYTRSASCAGLSFFPNDSATGYFSSGTLRYRTTVEGDGYFLCDPGLPNGAVVTKVQFTLLDETSFRDVVNCAMVRSGLTTATATSAQVLAGPLRTSGDQEGLSERPSDTSIEFATINNAKFGYWLQCKIESNGSSGPQVGIYGAEVIYKISAAKG